MLFHGKRAFETPRYRLFFTASISFICGHVLAYPVFHSHNLTAAVLASGFAKPRYLQAYWGITRMLRTFFVRGWLQRYFIVKPLNVVEAVAGDIEQR